MPLQDWLHHTSLRLSGQWEAMPGPLSLRLKLYKQRRQKRYISAHTSSNSTYTALCMTKLLLSHKVRSRTPKVVGLEHHRLQPQSGTHSLLCTNNTGAIGVSIILIIPQSNEDHYCKWSRKAAHKVWTRYCTWYAFAFS